MSNPYSTCLFPGEVYTGLWPIRPKPLPDELLSSWLVRLAYENGLKLHTFSKMLFGERQIWNRDIDKLADLEMFKILERGTGTPIEKVCNTSLMAYKNWIVDDVNAYGNTRWVLPLGIYHRIRRSNGIQYCPKCLADPKGPYYRRRWRLGFVVACAEHATILLDECPACKAPISFHRREMGNKAGFPDGRIELCSRCHQDLSRVPSIEIPSSEMKFHHFLANSITNGWVEAPDGKPVYAHLYLDVLHQIMKLLISSNSRGLGTIVSNASGLALVQTAYSGPFRTGVPIQFGHPFRFNSDSHSDSIRTGVPV